MSAHFKELNVAERVQWPGILRDTAAEVFSKMVGGTVAFPETTDSPVVVEVTGMVGIAGPLCATLSLRCTLQCATLMASHMLGVLPDQATEQRADAIGEICNMVGGYFKANIGLGEACVLSVPAVVVGKDYKICSLRQDSQIKLPLIYERESALVALDIRL
jgi:chemotaxis protein CheX